MFFTKSAEERDAWLDVLSRASRVIPFEKVYTLGVRACVSSVASWGHLRLVFGPVIFQKEIGSGRFSKVYEATNKATGSVVAVKLITKADLKDVRCTRASFVCVCDDRCCGSPRLCLQNERELLRTEIAVLKLVKHPHIVRLEDVFETPQTIYIVMERVKGGELFHRIVGRPRFTEPEARALVIPLLQAVAYIHGMGIIHRDIKPENILCGNSLTDIKLADFGLSKLVTPQEIMKMACGTLSYVAPEVLTMKGYGKEADLWSVGVILYLMYVGSTSVVMGNVVRCICGSAVFEEGCRLKQRHARKFWPAQQLVARILPTPFGKSGAPLVCLCRFPPPCCSILSRRRRVCLHLSGRSFVAGLLAKDPKKRLTAEQALKHPWMSMEMPAVSLPFSQ